MDLFEVLKREGDRRGLRFVMIGGFAVSAYGYSRTTGDIDILVARQESAAWSGILGDLGYSVHSEGAAFLQLSPPLQEMWPVDLMLVNEPTFENFWAHAREAEIHGTPLKVPSLEHLFALKLHALKHGLPHREAKDLNDLIHLIHFNKVRTDDEPFQRLFERYGTPEIHERLQAAIRSLPPT